MGSRALHANWISVFTGIDQEVLQRPSPFQPWTSATLDNFCIARKMSWAARRETTRVEDSAYCLLGLFNVNMPLLYGEGERAFRRLQEELIKTNDDDSILAWNLEPDICYEHGYVPNESDDPPVPWPLLASSPAAFMNCRALRYNGSVTGKSFSISKTGLHVELPLVRIPKTPTIEHRLEEEWVGILDCWTGDPNRFLGITLLASLSLRVSAKVTRAAHVHRPLDVFGTRRNTIMLGPKAVMHAQHRRVTIMEISPEQRVGPYEPAATHIFVLEGESLSRAGYTLQHAASRASLRNLWPDNPKWNATEKVMTFPGAPYASQLALFEFGNRQNFKTNFTVFVQDCRVHIRWASSIPEHELHTAEFNFGDRDYSETESRTLHNCPDGSGRSITVGFTRNDVSFSRLLTLHVDIAGRDDVNEKQSP